MTWSVFQENKIRWTTCLEIASAFPVPQFCLQPWQEGRPPVDFPEARSGDPACPGAGEGCPGLVPAIRACALHPCAQAAPSSSLGFLERGKEVDGSRFSIVLSLSHPSNYKMTVRFRGHFLLTTRIIFCSSCLSPGTSQSSHCPSCSPGPRRNPSLMGLGTHFPLLASAQDPVKGSSLRPGKGEALVRTSSAEGHPRLLKLIHRPAGGRSGGCNGVR